MFRSTFLPLSHYAGKWVIPEEEQRNDLAAVNLLGYAYATAPDSLAKEAKLLEVMECFHGYLMKYLCMIVRGTIPPANSRAGRDAMEPPRVATPSVQNAPVCAISQAIMSALTLWPMSQRAHPAKRILPTHVASGTREV
jgi:hypothetical protein